MTVSHNPKTDRWDVQAWYRTYDGSRKKKHKRGFRTKAEARRWERDFLLRAEGSPRCSSQISPRSTSRMRGRSSS